MSGAELIDLGGRTRQTRLRLVLLAGPADVSSNCGYGLVEVRIGPGEHRGAGAAQNRDNVQQTFALLDGCNPG